ncbi:MAG: hypothetical protein LBV50_00635 [Novosphingobium sp.]|jgi:hemolysin activation/secretion protein|nr:hypothetical protein [Novosphingobium sp.]
MDDDASTRPLAMKMARLAMAGLGSAALFSAGAMANAQTVPDGRPGINTLPDAGALERAQQQRRDELDNRPPLPQEREPVIRDERPEPELTDSASTARFRLKSVVFTPSRYLGEEELQAIAGRHVGEEVAYGDLQGIIGEINALYRQHRILTARAILPPQRVADGVVRIELVEGRLGEVSIDGARTTRKSWITGWTGLTVGGPLDTHRLERRLELYNHVNDSQIGAKLHPGSAFGETDLQLQVQEPPRFQLRVFADNEGAESIGGKEVGLDAAINSPLGRGDRLGLYYVHAAGADFGMVNYAVPLNHRGSRLGLSFSDIYSHVVSGPYKDFGVRGHSQSGQLQFSQPIAHFGRWWLDGALAGGISRSSNEILDADLGNDTVRFVSGSLTAIGQYDTSTFTVSLTNRYNWIGSDTEPDRGADLWQFSGTWVQKITGSQYTVVRLGGQYSGTHLLTSNLAMQMGGNSTVRGYPLGAIAGDDGYYANLEYHRRLSKGVAGMVFADFGGVHTSGTPDQHISSVGVGLDMTLFKNLAINVTAARASNRIIPDQDRFRVTARISWKMF